jgi:hypothetical protein
MRPDAKIFIYELEPVHLPLLENRDKRITYNAIGLGGYYDNPEMIKYQLMTLKDMMKENNHKYIDVLKMDIEYSEYDFLKYELDLLQNVGQFYVEVHAKFTNPINNRSWVFVDTVETSGLRLFHQEVNKHVPYFASEYSFIQKNWISFNKNKNDFNL